jgi:hypothetical protein
MVKIAQSESVEVWDAGLYKAKVISCEQTESTWPGKEGTPRFKWVIRVTNDEGEHTDIWHWTGATLSKHPNATLRPFVQAVLPGAELDAPDAELDTDDLVGKRCQVILGVNAEKGRNTIEKVLPAEGRKVAKPAPEPVAVGAGTGGDSEPPF